MLLIFCLQCNFTNHIGSMLKTFCSKAEFSVILTQIIIWGTITAKIDKYMCEKTGITLLNLIYILTYLEIYFQSYLFIYLIPHFLYIFISTFMHLSGMDLHITVATWWRNRNQPSLSSSSLLSVDLISGFITFSHSASLQ